MAFGLGSAVPMLKPVSDWVDPRRNALMGLSAGFLQGDPSAAMRYAMQGSGVDRQYMAEAAAQAKAEEERNATAEWLKQSYPQFANLPPAQGFEAAMKMMAQAQSGGADALKTVGGHLYDTESGEWISPPATDNRQNISLQGQWGRDAQGNPVFLQPSSTGEMIPARVPEGVSLVDPATMAGDKTRITVDEKTAAAARAALPGAEQMQEITKTTIGEVRANAKGMAEWFGQVGPRGMYVHPGSEMGKFYAAASPTNAQAFMQARDMLKGGGPITDYEGRRAEDAMSRMQAALDTGDQQAYLKAIADFEDAVATGYAKLVETAQGGYSSGSVGGAPDLKSKYGLE